MTDDANASRKLDNILLCREKLSSFLTVQQTKALSQNLECGNAKKNKFFSRTTGMQNMKPKLMNAGTRDAKDQQERPPPIGIDAPWRIHPLLSGCTEEDSLL